MQTRISDPRSETPSRYAPIISAGLFSRLLMKNSNACVTACANDGSSPKHSRTILSAFVLNSIKFVTILSSALLSMTIARPVVCRDGQEGVGRVRGRANLDVLEEGCAQDWERADACEEGVDTRQILRPILINHRTKSCRITVSAPPSQTPAPTHLSPR